MRDAVAPPIIGPLISLRNIEKVFETPAGQTYVLRRISGDIQPGEFVSIMGPSGAGKSTLLAILGMLDSAWTGEFYFVGHPVHAMSHKQRVALNKEHIGFVFQQYHLLDDLTVAENLDIPLSYRNVKKSEREAIVADTLDRFGMVGKKDLYPRQLSGGQQQLVGVARAVIAKPKLILADEPTGNLHSTRAARSWTCSRSSTTRARRSFRSRTRRRTRSSAIASSSCATAGSPARKGRPSSQYTGPAHTRTRGRATARPRVRSWDELPTSGHRRDQA